MKVTRQEYRSESLMIVTKNNNNNQGLFDYWWFCCVSRWPTTGLNGLFVVGGVAVSVVVAFVMVVLARS